MTISVTSATEAGDPRQFVFTKDRVTIGRDPACDVVLADPKRIVSKEHAAIERASDGFELVDLGSKNFTFLNGTRLRSGEPQALSLGDAVRIGEFELAISVAAAEPAPPDDRTVFLVNPFDAAARQFADLLETIDATYQNEIPGRREEALRQAFRSRLRDRAEQLDLLDQALGEERRGSSVADQSAPAPAYPKSAAKAKAKPDDRRRGGTPAAARPAYTPGAAYDRVFDVFVRMLPKLLGVPWRFRHEFIGQTIMHSPDAETLYEGDPQDIRRYLLDPNVPDDELERRAEFLNDASEDLLVHALAMVDGYKGSVQQGVARLLDEVDPARVEAEIREGGNRLHALPLIREMKTVQRLKQKVNDLRGEDWAVAERRIHRPAFIKAYLARMTSKRRDVD